MNELSKQTNAAFLEVTTHKLGELDKKVGEVEQTLATALKTKELMERMDLTLHQLQQDIYMIRQPEEKSEQLVVRLDRVIQTLNRPLQHKVMHHQYPALFWISAALLLGFTLLLNLWITTQRNLSNFTERDAKYRYMRLDTGYKFMQRYLDRIDSLHLVNPDFRKEVLKTEESYWKNIERLEKAARLKKEALSLEKAVKRK